MSGFDTSWLDLREPADRAARDQGLLQRAAAVVSAAQHPGEIVDLGCGTGSTCRAFAGRLPAGTRWRFFDHDERLLAEAGRRTGAAGISVVRGDLDDIDGLPLGRARLATASALFDLVSEDWLRRFSARLSGLDLPLYAALTFDGRVEWNHVHEDDTALVTAFNAHQRRDKGFGPALGPLAGAALAEYLALDGFLVETAPSDWRLGAEEAALHRAFVQGIARAAGETLDVEASRVEAWLAFRAADAERGGTCRVGHIDLLAVRR